MKALIEDLRIWLARKLLTICQWLTYGMNQYNGQRGWMFDANWKQPNSPNDLEADNEAE